MCCRGRSSTPSHPRRDCLRCQSDQTGALSESDPSVPQRQREADVLMPIGDAGEPVLIPAIGSRAGVIVRKVVPRGAVRAVVFADGAPGAFTEVGSPALPVGGPFADSVVVSLLRSRCSPCVFLPPRRQEAHRIIPLERHVWLPPLSGRHLPPSQHHAMAVGVADQNPSVNPRLHPVRSTTPGETNVNVPGTNFRRRSTSDVRIRVCQCRMSLALSSTGIRPAISRRRYSRNSMPGPELGARAVMRKRAPNTLLRCSCSDP